MATASDNFNRSDENLETSANWTAYGTGSLEVSSNAVSARSAFQTDKTGYSGETWTDDQKASATILDLASGSSWFGPAVRCGTGSGGSQGYSAEVRPNGDVEVYLNGATLIDDIAAGLIANDVLEVEAVGTTITVRVNDSDVGGGTNATVSSGDPGLLAYMPSGELATNIFDDFNAADVAGVASADTSKNLLLMGVG